MDKKVDIVADDYQAKVTELLTDLVIPAVDNYDTGFVFWGDGSLADRNYDFETVSDTLIFGIVQYDIQALLWAFEFKVVNEDLLRRVHSTVSRYLLSKTQLGWFGTTVVKDAFSISMAKNNSSTREARQLFIDLLIALPYTLKQTYMEIARKH
jgi:phage tail sheath protein FI